VSTRSPELRATNPVVNRIDGILGTDDEAVELQFDVSSSTEVELWGVATSGGFAAPFISATTGLNTLAFYPSTTTDGEVFVVAVQPDGGSDVWRGQASELW